MDIKSLIKRVAGRKQELKPSPFKNGMHYVQGNWMYLDDRDSLKLAQYGIYEIEDTHYIQEHINQEHIVVDIGANIGYYTLMLAKQAKYVYAFEPDPTNFAILKKNANINNHSGKVNLHQKGAAESQKKVPLHLCDFNRGMHRLVCSSYSTSQIEIETVAIGDIVDYADFVKIDIEGAELDALKGMKNLLEKGTNILMEFNPEAIKECGTRPYDVYKFIKEYDYQVNLHGKEVKDYADLEKEALSRVGTNILCVRHG